MSAPTGAVKVTMAPHCPVVLFTLMFAGQVMVGNWLSATETVNEQLAVFPKASVTLKVLVVVPTGKAAPDAKPVV